MRITTDLFIVLCYVILVRLVSSKQPFPKNKKKMNQSLLGGRGKQAISNQIFLQFDRSAYPASLPTNPPKKVEPSPYKTLYQGLRNDDDQRVFRKRFNYDAMMTGQQIICQGLFDCIISHVAIESTEAIPVLMRGGVGYRHFTAVIKARPHHDLKGQIRAYCKNNYVPEEESHGKSVAPQRRFYFGELLDDEYLNKKT